MSSTGDGDMFVNFRVDKANGRLAPTSDILKLVARSSFGVPMNADSPDDISSAE
jgi:hypothetical protein